MEDNDLFALFWKCAASVFCVGIVVSGGCTAHQNYLNTQVLASTGNPVALSCALKAKDDQNTPFCVEAAKSLNK